MPMRPQTSASFGYGPSALSGIVNLLNMGTQYGLSKQQMWQNMLNTILQGKLTRKGQQDQSKAARKQNELGWASFAMEPMMDTATMAVAYPMIRDLMKPAQGAWQGFSASPYGNLSESQLPLTGWSGEAKILEEPMMEPFDILNEMTNRARYGGGGF